MESEQIPTLEHNPGGREVEPSIGLSPDAINAWNNLGMISQVDESFTGRIAEKAVKRGLAEQMPSYEEYLTTKYPDRVERIMSESNPDAVAQLDALVVEFNAVREELSQRGEGWKEKVQEFRTRAEALLLTAK